MFEIFTFQKRPRWLANVVAVLLLILSSAMLLFFCRSGPPSRLGLGILMSILLLTPALVNWRWGWDILYCYMPFGTFIRRVYLVYQPANSSGNDPLIVLPDLLMASMAFGYLVMIRTSKVEQPLWGEKPLRLSIILFMVLCGIEVFNPQIGSVTVGMNGLRIFTLWMMLYFIAQQIIRKVEDIYRWIVIMLLCGSVSGLYGAFQYIYGFPSWDQTWAEQNAVTFQTIGESMRAFSTFTFTSTFSQYMIITCCAATVCMQAKKMGLFTRLLAPFFLGSMLLGLAMTFVRSSYLGLIVAWTVGIVVAGRAEGRMKRLFAVLAVSFVLVSLVPKAQGDVNATYDENIPTTQLVADRLATMAEPSHVGSFSIRTAVWQRVVEYSFSYPAGVGLGAGAAARFTGDYWTSAAAYTESQVFSVLAEMGWPGLFLYLFIALYALIYALRVYDTLEDPELKPLVQLMIMLQVGIFVCGVSGGVVLYTLPGSAFYWSAMGVVTAIARIEGLTVEKVEADRAAYKAALKASSDAHKVPV